MVDLGSIFGKLKVSKLPHTRDYLDKFMPITVFWDTRHTSKNLDLDFTDTCEQILTCKHSLESFKTAYGADPLC